MISRNLEPNSGPDKRLGRYTLSHSIIQRITQPMLGFKAFHSASATLAVVETAHMICNGQFDQKGVSPFKQFAASKIFAAEPIRLADLRHYFDGKKIVLKVNFLNAKTNLRTEVR